MEEELLFYTSVEQGRKLVELGIEQRTADLFWSMEPYVLVVSRYMTEDKCIPCVDAVPCWSVGAMMDIMLMPVLYMSMEGGMIVWNCQINFMVHYDGDETHKEIGSTQVEACYNMLVWLLENGHL